LATLKPQAAPMMGAGTPQVTSQVADHVPAGDSQEVTGITEEIVEKLQEKATVLTQERKKRGKTVPEGLCSSESMKQFSVKSSIQDSTLHLFQEFWLWILVSPIPTR